jgi:hypothetical protein
MEEVGVYQSTGDEPVILVPYADGRRPKDKVVHYTGVVKGGYRDQ